MNTAPTVAIPAIDAHLSVRPSCGGFSGLNGRVSRVRTTEFGPVVTLRFDNPLHGFGESQFFANELEIVTPNIDDEF